ncbi:MAG: hypothetical protein R2724_06340 [Bryobacterales bacterium]
MLMRLSGFAPEMLAHGPDDPSEPIAALGFTTRRRASELRRALDSYAANFQRHGRSPEIVIIDDSRNPEDEAETRAMLREFQRGPTQRPLRRARRTRGVRGCAGGSGGAAAGHPSFRAAGRRTLPRDNRFGAQ